MKSALVACLLATTVCFGQIKQTGTTGEARTSGPCSPAITGSNNRILISGCLGAKKERVEQPALHEKEKMIEFSLGNGINASWTPEFLRKTEVYPLKIEDYAPIKLRLRGDLLVFSLKLRSPDGKTTLEIENNEFTVNMPGCDWNYNANALEIVDQRGLPIFQMIKKSPLRIVINGSFIYPGGFMLASPNGFETTRKYPTGFHLDPIFKYPAWKFPGIYADGSN